MGGAVNLGVHVDAVKVNERMSEEVNGPSFIHCLPARHHKETNEKFSSQKESYRQKKIVCFLAEDFFLSGKILVISFVWTLTSSLYLRRSIHLL